MYHICFIYSSVNGHLDCFHVLAIVNSAAMNIGIHVSFLFVTACIKIFAEVFAILCQSLLYTKVTQLYTYRHLFIKYSFPFYFITGY